MFFLLLSLFLTILYILLRVAFFTLLERKGLAYSQNRKGPDKNLGAGFFQPVLDALKLLTKKTGVPHQISPFLFFFVPALFFLIIVFLWFSFQNSYSNLGSIWGIFFFISISGVSSIILLIIGVSSQSKFGVLGGLRGVAQGVRYEIIFSITIFLHLFFFSCGGAPERFFTPSLFFFFLWVICVVAEANRAPFDFAEGERELIRGFNIEYRGGPFVLIFLGEYGFILGIRFLTAKIFFLWPVLPRIFFFFLVVIIRGLFPRFRYDFLIGLCWFSLLPLVLFGSITLFYYKI